MNMTIEQIKKRTEYLDTLKQDMVIPMSRLYMNPDASIRLDDAANGLVLKDTSEVFDKNMASKLGLNQQSFIMMKHKMPHVLAQAVNILAKESNAECMIRSYKKHPLSFDTVYPEDDIRPYSDTERYGRAFLSRQYARYDNSVMVDVIADVLPTGMDITSSFVDDASLYVKAVTPKTKQIEVLPGDVYQVGMMFRNSEIGIGALQVCPFLYRLVCTNGMVVQEKIFSFSRAHRGKVLQTTYDLPLLTMEHMDFSAVKDGLYTTINSLLQDETHIFQRVIKRIQVTAEMTATLDSLTLTQNLAKTFKLSEFERSKVEEHYLESSDFTLHGLTQAVTRTAQDVCTYTRSNELETIGGEMIRITSTQWKALNKPIEDLGVLAETTFV